MKWGRISVWIVTILLIAGALRVGKSEMLKIQAEQPLLSLKLSLGNNYESVYGWQKETGEYFVFLPGDESLSQAQIQIPWGTQVSVDGTTLQRDQLCEGLSLNTPYALTVLNSHKETRSTITFVASNNIPSIFLDTASGDMDYIHMEKGNGEAGNMRLYLADGTLAYQGNLEEIKGRGNATWRDLDKKPYSLTLMDQADLLGMGNADEWILLANGFDASNLRNKIVYDFAGQVCTVYSPECQWVNLYLNGKYAGLYLLCERNEVGSNRLNIQEDNSFLVSSDLGWRLNEYGRDFFYTPCGLALRIRYCSLPDDQLHEIWRAAEAAILASDGVDPVTGKHWRELIDEDSFARKFLIEEIFGNADAGSVSQFFYFDGADPSRGIVAGPIWDYDITMGNPANPGLTYPEQFHALRPYFLSQTDVSLYYHLYQDPTFAANVKQLYKEEFRPQLTELFENRVETYTNFIEAAARMNQIRWESTLRETYDESVTRLVSFMKERLDFLDSLWLEGQVYCVVNTLGDTGAVVSYAVKPGQVLPPLPSKETETRKWYRVDTDTPYDITQPIYEDVTIYLKTLSAAAD